jgi:hypothetical protein
MLFSYTNLAEYLKETGLSVHKSTLTVQEQEQFVLDKMAKDPEQCHSPHWHWESLALKNINIPQYVFIMVL